MSREVLDFRSSSAGEDVEDQDVSFRSHRPTLPRRTPVPLALAFLLGGLAGALGWDTWQEQRAMATAKATVDLSARLRNVTTAGESTPDQAYVQLENVGPETVRIEEMAIAGPGYVRPSDVSIPPLEIMPEQSATKRIAFDIACGDFPDVTAQVQLQVRTADGRSRPVLLPLLDEQRHLRQTRTAVCRRETQLHVSVSGGEAGTVIEQPDRVLRVPVWIQSHSTGTTTITSIRAASPQLDATAEGLPLEILGNLYSWTFVNWRVLDCTGATSLDFEDFGLAVSGRQADGPVLESTVPLDPDLALDVSAFVTETCSQR